MATPMFRTKNMPMFYTDFQGGPIFEMLDAKLFKGSPQRWAISGPHGGVKDVFDRSVKGYVITVQGSTTTKLQIPKDERKAMYLSQNHLLLQIFVPDGEHFSVDVRLNDSTSSKRRIVLSTAVNDISVNPLHARVPIGLMRRNVWLNFCVDIASLVSGCWGSVSTSSKGAPLLDNIDLLIIGPKCRLRKVMTCKDPPPDTTGDWDNFPMVPSADLPRSIAFPPSVEYVNQVLSFSLISAYVDALKGEIAEAVFEKAKYKDKSKGKGVLHVQDGLTSTRRDYDGPMHIAFGKRVATHVAPLSPTAQSPAHAAPEYNTGIGNGSGNGGGGMVSSVSAREPPPSQLQQPRSRIPIPRPVSGGSSGAAAVAAAKPIHSQIPAQGQQTAMPKLPVRTLPEKAQARVPVGTDTNTNTGGGAGAGVDVVDFYSRGDNQGTGSRSSGRYTAGGTRVRPNSRPTSQGQDRYGGGGGADDARLEDEELPGVAEERVQMPEPAPTVKLQPKSKPKQQPAQARVQTQAHVHGDSTTSSSEFRDWVLNTAGGMEDGNRDALERALGESEFRRTGGAVSSDGRPPTPKEDRHEAALLLQRALGGGAGAGRGETFSYDDGEDIVEVGDDGDGGGDDDGDGDGNMSDSGLVRLGSVHGSDEGSDDDGDDGDGDGDGDGDTGAYEDRYRDGDDDDANYDGEATYEDDMNLDVEDYDVSIGERDGLRLDGDGDGQGEGERDDQFAHTLTQEQRERDGTGAGLLEDHSLSPTLGLNLGQSQGGGAADGGGADAVGTEGEEDALDLIFDPDLNCYFDPATNQYYKLKDDE